MKGLFSVAVLVLFTVASRGGPTEDAIVAAMKLADESSYSWSTTVSDDAGTYDIEGKTVHEGWTWLRLPVTRAIGRRH